MRTRGYAEGIMEMTLANGDTRPLRTPRSSYWKDVIKLWWTTGGAILPSSLLHKSRIWLNYLAVARWLKDQNLSPKSRVQGGREVFRTVAESIAQKPVLYLEFGVFKGYTMSQWSVLLKNPETRFVGFDSFEGLPEDWAFDYPKGTFTAHGAIPQIADPRVNLVKGWFEDTVPKYAFVERESLVVFFDADLYSSSIFVLRALKSRIKVGTTLIFGEFDDFHHERRAFDDFLKETGWKFELTVADYSLVYVAFKRIE
jgi:Macrocin-O-methyltransferase (TylF)